MKSYSLYKKVFLKTLPVLAGYLVLGIGFGILLEKNGYGIFFAFLMSLCIYGGSMQFVAIDLISGGASLLASAMMTLMVHARHLFYGISMIDKFKNTGKKLPYLAFSLTDETYSLIINEENIDKGKTYLLISIFNQIYWIIGSIIGSILGSAITFDTTGIDFAMTALFVSIFTEQWLDNKNHVFAMIGVGSSVISLFLFGKDAFLIPSMLLITILLTLIQNTKFATSHTDDERII